MPEPICPMSMTPARRPELTPLPRRMGKLPVDARGYPVPAFVEWCKVGVTPFEWASPGAPDAYPEFRVMNRVFFVKAVRQHLCWVCGEPLGVFQTFVIGPMCAVNRTSSEPPSHLECAVWSAINCPFLSRPQMVRRVDDQTAALHDTVAGTMLTRNPGVTLLWTTRGYTVFDDGRGKPLLEIGEPTAVAWYSQGRPATRAEVIASIESGLPLLAAECDREPTARQRTAGHEELRRRREAVTVWLPAEACA
jgi:hypothetical protein